MMKKPLIILSLGAGVQSTALLLMSIRGELPRIDHAIFADTQYEPSAVYEHLEWLKGLCAGAGIPLRLVTAGNLRKDAIEFRSMRASSDGKRFASIPLFVRNNDGSQGLIRRQCTSEYKIEPIERFIKRTILGIAPRARAPKEVVVDQWFGITWDESQRMRSSPNKWKRNVYPFCGPYGDNLLPKFWRRSDCVTWLEANYPERTVPRSACICCPYRSNEEWRRMRDDDPASFADAVKFDIEIRDADRLGQKNSLRKMLVGLPYVHRKMIPLGEVDLRSDEDKGQGVLGFVNECEGMCGV
jgi:hypothetical protein